MESDAQLLLTHTIPTSALCATASRIWMNFDAWMLVPIFGMLQIALIGFAELRLGIQVRVSATCTKVVIRSLMTTQPEPSGSGSKKCATEWQHLGSWQLF